MRIAVLSGKGGTGKTFVSVNLTAAAGQAVYMDCSVEQPEGRLFFKPEDAEETPVYTLRPEFDLDKCFGCQKCIQFCHFNALAYIKEKPALIPQACRFCGGCKMVCTQRAITETRHAAGMIEEGISGRIHVVTGVLNAGEPSSIPVIRSLLKRKAMAPVPIILDCPSGTGRSVMEVVSGADYCIVVTEPTLLGFHDFQIAYELLTMLEKPLGVVVNKADEPYMPLEDFCLEHQIPILQRFAWTPTLAQLCAKGEIAIRHDVHTAEDFRQILRQLQKEVLG